MNEKDKPYCIGSGNNDLAKEIRIAYNMMSYYPFVEYGILMESVKYEMEKNMRKRREEYHKNNKFKGRDRGSD